MQTTKIGDKGERLVAEALKHGGYEIIGRNWKCKVAEIDIIAKKNKILYFIEVKYRQTIAQGDGFDYITTQKLNHMQRAAELWVAQNDWEGEHQLIAASVVGDSGFIDIREVV